MSERPLAPSRPPRSLLPPRRASLFRRRLLDWFDRRRRDLPWRRTRDPYAITVSEFMLQQTPVASVIPYYGRFLRRFPDIRRLARADEQEVLHAWAGLGYYRRARRLLALARAVVRRHDGRIPADYDGLRSLPGVGPYTAAALASIAFGLPRACVDGNVARVLARVLCLEADPRAAPAARRLQEGAEQFLCRRRPGDFNQAMMELGALICSPRSPDCGACPVGELCRAFARGEQDRLPVRAGRPATVRVREWGAVIRSRGLVLLLQRSPADRWAGMWEFPHGPVLAGEEAERGVARIARECTGLPVRAVGPVRLLRYAFTHHRFDLSWACCRSDGGRVRPAARQAFRWCAPEALAGLPLPSPHRRIAGRLHDAPGERGSP